MTTYVMVVFCEQRRRSASDRVVCGTIRSGVKFAIQYISFYEYNILFVGRIPLKAGGTFSPSRDTSSLRQIAARVSSKSLMSYSMRMLAISKHHGT